ncbi:MAG: hypothetical protein US80_C0001G0016 [Candidatus Daviesbacteria bacterium GW2011_GWA2_38_17]|uniref:Uncharacterized protein n=1 Tax=Candidatus Daviesbacteria bacterium GW2011_GWF2_38_6 TaxID=1618432 RepID=A0A0G0KAV3_9BACT|nr:MAG: hypothetical protein US80_C0001G0016 [Candidatus Daviesbacteria bacterium GW2011_GWA2_38_17]KKQ76793.1 MAG: hypothetical protein US99_C0060G0002 [Candidatus Daviesbacteria bacterium GW2011_GWF2_38_6]
MSFSEILLQLYNTGILAIAIMALAIAIVIHAQLKSHPSKRR